MRCFVAVEVNGQIKKAVAGSQYQLRAKADIPAGEVKWTDPSAIHITLKFLGNVSDKELPVVYRSINEAVLGTKRFDLEIRGVGFFGSRSAKILWAAVKDGGELVKLAAAVENKLSEAGFAPEKRRFSGHLTLCRVRSFSAGVKLARMSREYANLYLGSTHIDRVNLYQSELTPTGPVYTVISSAGLI